MELSKNSKIRSPASTARVESPMKIMYMNYYYYYFGFGFGFEIDGIDFGRQARLLKEKDSLALTVKKLSRDLGKVIHTN